MNAIAYKKQLSKKLYKRVPSYNTTRMNVTRHCEMVDAFFVSRVDQVITKEKTRL